MCFGPYTRNKKNINDIINGLEGMYCDLKLPLDA